MGVVTTLLRLVGGVVGERVGSSLGDRLERSFFGSSEDESEEEDEADEPDETDESDDEEAADEGEAEEEEDESSEEESVGESVAERVTNALDSVTGGEDDESSSGLGDLDAMSDEDLQELAETLVGELNRRSEE